LVTGVADTFTVTAINSIGSSAASAASNSVTPLLTTVPPVVVVVAPVSAPDPIQTSKITSISPMSGPISGGGLILVKMIASDCKVSNISYEGKNLPLSEWSIIGSDVTIKVPAHLTGPVSLQIFNGCAPVLPAFTYEYTKPVVANPEIKPVEPVTDKPEIKVVNQQPTKKMEKIGTVYFASGTYFFNDAAKKTLAKIAGLIRSKSPEVILSYGHSDIKGGIDNVLLSKNRAMAVRKYLSAALDGRKIGTGWYAATKPINLGKNLSDLAKNRRVEVFIK
jgi:outer membrane protein OmpA-like peptidoglycan-associated protein